VPERVPVGAAFSVPLSAGQKGNAFGLSWRAGKNPQVPRGRLQLNASVPSGYGKDTLYSPHLALSVVNG